MPGQREVCYAKGYKSHPHSVSGRGSELTEYWDNNQGSVPIPCRDKQTFSAMGLVNMVKIQTFMVAELGRVFQC